MMAPAIPDSSTPRLSMTCSNPDLPVDGSNLCIQAARAFFENHTPEPSIASLGIHLNKEIPFGAGLGGGSSDAATVLEACSVLTSAPNRDRLLHMAALLGSDVPFFLKSPVAFGTGRGEILQDMSFPTALVGTWLVLAVPDERVNTAEAYRHIVPNDSLLSDLRTNIEHGDLQDWTQNVHNDFELSVFKSYPIVAELKQQMFDLGAGFSLMSGSGSSVFGVFGDRAEASHAVAMLAERWPAFTYWSGPAEMPDTA